jgi:structural maintenance of chromosome 4
MEFLRSNNLGKASIVSLEQQTQRYGNKTQGSFNAPEQVPRLFDLIKVNDPKVLAAFYFAIRDCLVANDLDQATRIGLGRERHKVVDLSGNIVDPGGTKAHQQLFFYTVF